HGTNPSVSTQQKFIYASKNGGVSWQQMATAPAAGVAYGLAASPSQSVVLATNQGIDLLPAGEMTWRTADLRGGAPAGGFRYIGMTTGDQGIALPADPSVVMPMKRNPPAGGFRYIGMTTGDVEIG